MAPVDNTVNDNTTSPSTMKTTFTPSRPTDGEFPIRRSGPPIMPATSSSSQFRRGRKSTSITAATQGKLVSSVTDESTFIPLRSLDDPGHPSHRRCKPDLVNGRLRLTPPASTSTATATTAPPAARTDRLSSSFMINSHDSLDPTSAVMLTHPCGRDTITAAHADDRRRLH
ncbi:hypothetical protein ACLOJK_039236 [Asimina triloba]